MLQLQVEDMPHFVTSGQRQVKELFARTKFNRLAYSKSLRETCRIILNYQSMV